jgi:hypothetical protein
MIAGHAAASFQPPILMPPLFDYYAAAIRRPPHFRRYCRRAMLLLAFQIYAASFCQARRFHGIFRHAIAAIFRPLSADFAAFALMFASERRDARLSRGCFSLVLPPHADDFADILIAAIDSRPSFSPLFFDTPAAADYATPPYRH